MSDQPLYQDAQFRVGYLPDSDDHFLEIGSNDEKSRYTIPYGVLEDLAREPRGSMGVKLSYFDDRILFDLEGRGIEIDGLHVALCQAYMKEDGILE